MHSLAILGIVLIAVALRFFTLGSADIVHDEYFTALYYQERAQWISNSLIYRLIVISQSIFGENEFSLRLPSFVFGAASVYLVYLFGRQIFSTSAGLLSAAILTVLPWHIWHSQYARYYALVVFFIVLMHILFVRAIRSDSVTSLVLGAGSALIAISAHVTAVLMPFCCWIVCAVLYFRPVDEDQQVSYRIVRIGFWAGVVGIVIMVPMLLPILSSWSGEHGWSNSPAQLIFQLYREIGALFLVTFFAIWILRQSKLAFAALYLGVGAFGPLIIVTASSFLVNIRSDYAISVVVPAIVASSTALVLIWRQRNFGREFALLLIILLFVEAMPRLISHYTNRIASYSINAVEFLLEQRQQGDRFAVFVPGVRFYLTEEVDSVEREGLGNPNLHSRKWPPIPLAPVSERLWLVFRVTRDDLAPDVRHWLRRNDARLVWRQVSPRLDSQVRGVEIFLVCPESFDKCNVETR